MNGEQIKKIFSKIIEKRLPFFKIYKRKIEQNLENTIEKKYKNLNDSDNLNQKLLRSEDLYLKTSSILWVYYKIQFEKYIYDLINTEV
jgi:hypothetical protein